MSETTSTTAESTVNPETLEVVPGAARRALEGWAPKLVSEGDLFSALEAAFDYRGDITLTLKDGRTIEGYLFDRRSGGALDNSLVRVIPKDSREKLNIRFSEIAAISFTGRDSAAGKSWEAWVKRYWQKRAAGEHAELQPESLEG